MKFYILRSCLWCIITSWMFTVVWTRNLLELIETESELTEFSAFIHRNNQIKLLLKSFSITVFAPTNDAWKRYNSDQPSVDVLNYHLVKSAVKLDGFSGPLPTETLGSIPIWITNEKNRFESTSPNVYFANQARVIQFDMAGQSDNDELQVLHIIDEVLQPTTLTGSGDIASRNPSAYRLISNPRDFNIEYSTAEFYKKVGEFRKELVLQGDRQTFFIPIDQNADSADRDVWNSVDEKVIDGHVIPNAVYFSKAFPSSWQQTLALTDMLRVYLEWKNESVEYGRYQSFINSRTTISYPSYPKGTVIAEIVRADIPVKNGVVHLISNPLIVTKRRIHEVLRKNSQLSQFYGLFQRYENELLGNVAQATVFAPTNVAFSLVPKSTLQVFLNNEVKLKEMLKLHIVQQIVTVESIVQGHTITVGTLDGKRTLRLTHSPSKSRSWTVVGGGINATIIDNDIIALNGMVQIIDKVMGITSYSTIYDKLSTDENLNTTFWLGNQKDYNVKFQDLNRRYTYFVPNNAAWDMLSRHYPNEYNGLAGGTKYYNLHKILNRHLVVHKDYSLQNMMNLGSIQMVEGVVTITKSGNSYYLNWDGEQSEIMDSDIETGNGKVHVIRSVLFKRRDLTGHAPELAIPSIIALVVSTLLIIFIV